MLKRIGLVVLVFLVALGLFVQFSHLPEPLADNLQTAEMVKKGPHKVASFDITLVDDTRPMQPNNEFPGADKRTLKTRIWYPRALVGKNGEAAPEALPLLIYSHGFMSTRTGGAYLAEHMASHGYIVASMDYPLTNFNAPGGPLVKDVVNQPGDVSFLLDQFLSWHQEDGHDFYGAVDEGRLGVFGLSLGGMTTTMVAFHPALGDPRVDAAISIAGPSFLFSKRFFEHRDIPFMMVATEIDALVDYQSNAAPIPQKDPDALLVTLEDGTHTGFADMARYLRWMHNPDQIGCEQVTANIENDDESPWYDLIGSKEQGIVVTGLPELCTLQPLPEAMNPIQQQWLTTAAVSSFFRGQFADTDEERQIMMDYLRAILPQEMAAVTVQ